MGRSCLPLKTASYDVAMPFPHNSSHRLTFTRVHAWTSSPRIPSACFLFFDYPSFRPASCPMTEGCWEPHFVPTGARSTCIHCATGKNLNSMVSESLNRLILFPSVFYPFPRCSCLRNILCYLNKSLMYPLREHWVLSSRLRCSGNGPSHWRVPIFWQFLHSRS